MAGKISESDKATLTNACNDTIKWVDEHGQNASKEEFEHKKQELESTCNPIISRAYQSAAGGGAGPGAGAGFPGGGAGAAGPTGGGPSVEEVD